jgi:hypothetical protein
MLASDCHAVSTNFLTLVRDTPKGEAFPSDDQSSLFICSSSKESNYSFGFKNNLGYVRVYHNRYS